MTIKATMKDIRLYKGLLRTAKRHRHYTKTWQIYNFAVKITKSHSKALDLAYWDLYLDSTYDKSN